jgi:putative nucleotide binding protein
MRDEYAIVLDFLSRGLAAQRREFAVAQILGEEHFNLLEVVPREEVILKAQDRIYIGEGKRDQIKSIRRKLRASELTATAQTELDIAVEKLVGKNEKKFVDFFNNAGPVTTKQHQLELLPGIGKKHMWQIIEERKKNPFKNFEDLKKRVILLPDPKRAVIKRILDELDGKTKWYLFVVPPRGRE